MRRLTILLVLVTLVLSGCGEALNNLVGAEIVSLDIEPSTISLSETGMTDEFFTATIVVNGFTDPVDADEAVVFLQEPSRVEAQPGFREIDQNTITLGMIAKSWAGGLDTGVYAVGAQVSSETEEVTQLDLATITIEE